MRKLFAILMSFQLIVAPVALAQDEKVSSDPGDQFRSNPNAKGKTDYFQMIMGLGTSIVGSSALVGCKLKSPSVITLGVGSLVHVMSEIMGGKAHNDALKKSAADMEMVEEKMKANGGGGEVQRASLEAALSNEKEILKFINKRKMWTQLLFAVYAAGTALAALEAANVFHPPVEGCDPASMGAKGKLTTAAIGAAFSFFSGGIVQGLVQGILFYTVGATAIASAVLNNKYTRVGYFVGVTLIQGIVMKSLGKKADTAKRNIEKLEKAIAEFDKNSTTSTSIAQDTSTSDTDLNKAESLGNSNNVKTLPATAQVQRLCASNSSNGINFSSSSCASPLRLQAPKIGADLQVPTIAAFNQGLTDVGNQLAAGDLEGAEIGAAGLASQAARLNQIKDNAIKKMNENLKAQGKKPLDINAEAKAQLASMSNALKQDPNISNALAALSRGEEASLSDDLKGIADLKEVQDLKAAEAQADKKGEETATPNSMLGGIDTETGFEQVDASGKVDDIMKTDDFEYAKDDVRKDKETSLFQMVSNRYILNYNRFFKKAEPTVEEKKTSTPAPAPTSN